MSSDDNTQNNQSGGYMGGFSFGDSGSSGQSNPGPTPPTSPTPPSSPKPTATTTPASQPVAATPVPTSKPAQAAPMAGMMDDDFAQTGTQDPGDPNYVFGAAMQHFKTTIKLPKHSLSFDEVKFLNLLAGSISLTKDEKKRIIDSTPKLRQDQVDELMRIFEEERSKFVELSAKHSTQLKKLEQEHAADWKDLEIAYHSEKKANEDAGKAEDIRKQLGL